MKLSRHGLLVVIVGMAAVVVPAACNAPPAPPSGVDKGEHLTLAEARGRVQLELPDTAADIRFYQHLKPDQVVVADFAVSEDAFLRWAAEQGWKMEPVQGGVTIWPRARFGDQETEVLVWDGYNHHDIHRGAPDQLSITFDRKTKRGYYNFDSKVAGDN